MKVALPIIDVIFFIDVQMYTTPQNLQMLPEELPPDNNYDIDEDVNNNDGLFVTVGSLWLWAKNQRNYN